MNFLYKYRDKDIIVKQGRTAADTREKAIDKLARLGIDPLSVWADGSPEPVMKQDKLGKAMQDAVTPPPEPKKPEKAEPTPLSDKEAKEILQEEPRESVLQVPQYGPPPSLLLEAELASAVQAQTAPLPMPPKARNVSVAVTSEQLNKSCPRRRQSFILEEQDKAAAMIEDYLNRKAGKVVTMQVISDLHGKIQVAMVIDHDDI